MIDEITFEFATRDDCLSRMIPSDLRSIIRERDALRAKIELLQGAFVATVKEVEFYMIQAGYQPGKIAKELAAIRTLVEEKR